MRGSLAVRVAVVTVWVVALLGTTALAVAHTPRAARPAPSERVCFPAGKWDADDAVRPCARITGVYEDGSVEVAVSDADGTVRYTTGVGNLQD